MSERSADYIVVGAGSAGGVVASRLSDDPQLRVTLIEAGGPDRHPLLRVPALSFMIQTFPGHNWNYFAEPEAELGGRRQFWSNAKILGGGSSINGMMYVRGHSREYDAWGVPGWAFEDVLPYFRKSETNERGPSHWHGDRGPMKVVRGRSLAPICDVFLDATAQAGYARCDDLNTDVIEGFGHYDFCIDRGFRSGVSAAFLRPARRRTNLRVEAGAQVLRIIVEGGRARGVELLQNGVKRRLLAEREVIVSCGAVNSPQLLMLSGVGSADDLRALGITVHVDLPSVGKNLQNHYRHHLRYACTAPLTGYNYVRPFGAAKTGLEYAFRRQGPLSSNLISIGGYVRTRGDLPDVKVSMVGAMMGSLGSGTGISRFLGMLPKQHGISFLINQGSPASRGEVRLRSADPLVPPQIFPRNFSEPGDMDVLIDGTERVLDILEQKAIRDYLGASPDGQLRRGDRKAMEAEIRRTGINNHHVVGSCRMGVDADSVVDPELKVRGVEGLRVADASVIPVLMNANTNAPAIMVGEKAADMVLGR